MKFFALEYNGNKVRGFPRVLAKSLKYCMRKLKEFGKLTKNN